MHQSLWLTNILTVNPQRGFCPKSTSGFPFSRGRGKKQQLRGRERRAGRTEAREVRAEEEARRLSPEDKTEIKLPLKRRQRRKGAGGEGVG